jgi:hypothetical protein
LRPNLFYQQQHRLPQLWVIERAEPGDYPFDLKYYAKDMKELVSEKVVSYKIPRCQSRNSHLLLVRLDFYFCAQPHVERVQYTDRALQRDAAVFVAFVA